MNKENLRRQINEMETKTNFDYLKNKLSEYYSIKNKIANIEYEWSSFSVGNSFSNWDNLGDIKNIFNDAIDEYNICTEFFYRIEDKFEKLIKIFKTKE